MDWINNLIVVIIVAGILISIFFVFLLYKILQVRKKKKVVGEFIGETAITIDHLRPNKIGYVRFRGELWKAQANKEIDKDIKVKILDKDGSILTVVTLDDSTKH